MGARRFRIALATASLMVASVVLAACGGGTDSGSAAQSQPATSGGGQTVTVWHYFSADNQVQLMDKYAEMFEAAHDGVTVENVFVPYDQMMSKLVSATGAGEGPDVAVFNGAEYSTLALANAIVPIDDYMSSWSDASQLAESVVHKLDGKTYAVQGYVNLLGLWYNKEILTEIGVQPPTTIDELESAMQAAKDAGYQGITLSGLPQGQGEWQAYPWLTSDGFSYDNPDPAALEKGLARVRSWVEQGYLSQEAVTWDQTVPFQNFTSGGVAFAENGNWQMGAAAADAGFEYGVVQLPLSSTGGVYLGGEGQAIGASSKNPDLAWEYLTATYLSAEGQAAAAEIVGSIPSRLDAASLPAVTGNELLVPFADTVANFGANYPAQAIKPESVPDVQLAMGQAWSAVLGGQQDAASAAQQVVSRIQSLLVGND